MNVHLCHAITPQPLDYPRSPMLKGKLCDKKLCPYQDHRHVSRTGKLSHYVYVIIIARKEIFGSRK